MNRTKNVITIIIFLALSLAFIAYGSYRFNIRVDEELTASVAETIHLTTLQQQTALNDLIASKTRNILSITETLPIIREDSEAVVAYLQAMRERYHFSNLIVVHSDGVGVTVDLDTVDISDEPFFKTAMNGQVVVTEPYLSAYTNNEVVAVSAPIYYNGKIDGVLAVSYSIEYLNDLFHGISSELGHAVLMDDNGKVILGYDDSSQIASELKTATFYNDVTRDKIIDDLLSGKSGSFAYTINGNERFGEYIPININGWMLFFSSSKDTMMTAAEQSIGQSMAIYNTIMVLLFLSCMLYVVSSRRKNLLAIEKKAYYDELTGLANQTKLKLDLAKNLKTYPDRKYVIAKFDFENFKAINELYSFEVGNDVLRTVALTAKHATEPTFVIARVGIDEFTMFAANDFLNDLEAVSTKYEAIFKEMLPILSKHSLTFRYGRYFIEPGEYDVDEIINKVNMAHSFARENSGVTICDYDNSFKRQIIHNADITNKKEIALRNNEFKLYLQPKYRIMDDCIVGAEALVRWIEPDGNMIFPNDFIPIFERNGYIVELDKYMLSLVCKLIRDCLDRNEECVRISVNFSRLHLQNPNFVSEIKEIVKNHGVPDGYIEVEFTETAVTENEQDVVTLIDDLHNAGFTISIDDFGAGYSSLGMLKSFNVDTLKLDRSFFINNKDDRGDLVIGGIIKLAHTLDMRVVAEGIEDKEQVDFLKTVNCEVVQGYYYAKPMPASDFIKAHTVTT